jgi:hypothetical protein
VPASDLCVYCRRHPVDPRTRPFCSERCRLLDLGAWMDGRYRVAQAAPDDEEGVASDTLEEDEER